MLSIDLPKQNRLLRNAPPSHPFRSCPRLPPSPCHWSDKALLPYPVAAPPPGARWAHRGRFGCSYLLDRGSDGMLKKLTECLMTIAVLPSALSCGYSTHQQSSQARRETVEPTAVADLLEEEMRVSEANIRVLSTSNLSAYSQSGPEPKQRHYLALCPSRTWWFLFLKMNIAAEVRQEGNLFVFQYHVCLLLVHSSLNVRTIKNFVCLCPSLLILCYMSFCFSF